MARLGDSRSCGQDRELTAAVVRHGGAAFPGQAARDGQGRGTLLLDHAEYGNKMDESSRFSGLEFLATRRSPVVETEPMQACSRLEAVAERTCAAGTEHTFFLIDRFFL